MTVVPSALDGRRVRNRRMATIILLIVAALTVALVPRQSVFHGPSISNGVKGSGIQATQTRALPTFSEVNLVGANNVVVRAGRAQSVVVRGDDNLFGHITTRVKAGALAIGAKGRFTTKRPMSVGVNVPSLETVTLTGTGNITVQNVHAHQLTMTLSGSGIVRASGTVGQLHVTLVGAGDAQLRKLAAHDVRATLTGTGRIAVHPTGTLDASVVGVGTIVYSGKPASVTTTVTGSGAVLKG